MNREVMMIFTAKSVKEMLRVGGTQSWVLDPVRAKQCEYAVLCRNAHTDWGDGREPHGVAFMVGHIADVVPSTETRGRWLVKFDKYVVVDVPGAWKGWRNPVRYGNALPFSVEDLPFEPMPEPTDTVTVGALGSANTSKGLTIDEAKLGLAATFGVPPEAVEITIRG
jgi:hypothetical protein